MAPLSTLAITATTLLTLASANTVQFDLNKNYAVRDSQLRRRSEYNILKRALALDRRSNPVSVTLGNSESQGLYFANVTLGTPAQKVALQIDTGSSDVWVPATSASQCSSTRNGGCPDGSFDSSRSSTFAVVEEDGFNISYVDGTGASGDYFTDVFSIGGASLDAFQMGIGTDTTIGTGIMGIGYNTSEANVNSGNGTIYANLPIAMVQQGVINSVAYSLWLNDLDSSSGSVLFGGIDTAKYSGDLVSVDVYPTSRRGGITSFTVAWTSLSATSSSGTDQITPSDFAEPAILDSGTTITLLPDELAEIIFEELGATPDQSLGAVVVPCVLASNTGTINYSFGGAGGPTIKVAMSELVLPLVTTTGEIPKYRNGQDACQLGIQAAGSDPILFGDTFLRSAYVVYDLINNRIALAQSTLNATDSKVVAFESNGAAIPSATSAPNESQVTQTATGIPKTTADITATGGATVATYNPTATGLSASAGFAATGTSTSTSTKNAGGPGPAPFRWTAVWVGAVTVGLVGVGGGFFAML